MKINTKKYACFFCGKRDVKLWRPEISSVPLICAKCAEQRQIPSSLPRWEIDENGLIPLHNELGSEKEISGMTDELLVSLIEDGKTIYTPAIPTDEEGVYWADTSDSEETYDWWKNLPTR